MKILRRTVTIVILVAMISSCIAFAAETNTRYFHNNNPGTYNTYISSSTSFQTEYYTDANPTMEYRYRNLKCADPNGTLGVTLKARKSTWYNFISPKTVEIGTTVTTEGTGANATNGYWYGWTYSDIDSTGVNDLMSKYGYTLEEAYNIIYCYTIDSDYSYYCAQGDWQVICSYEN